MRARSSSLGATDTPMFASVVKVIWVVLDRVQGGGGVTLVVLNRVRGGEVVVAVRWVRARCFYVLRLRGCLTLLVLRYYAGC